MPATARFDLKMDAEEKDIIVKAAALTGTSMAGFVRSAAREKAMQLLEREARITLSRKDFEVFTQALEQAFEPNAALQRALDQVRKDVRRA